MWNVLRRDYRHMKTNNRFHRTNQENCLLFYQSITVYFFRIDNNHSILLSDYCLILFMPGKRTANKEGEWKDISSQVGFFYSPIDNRAPVRRQPRKVTTKHKPTKRKFAQTKYC